MPDPLFFCFSTTQETQTPARGGRLVMRIHCLEVLCRRRWSQSVWIGNCRLFSSILICTFCFCVFCVLFFLVFLVFCFTSLPTFSAAKRSEAWDFSCLRQSQGGDKSKQSSQDAAIGGSHDWCSRCSQVTALLVLWENQALPLLVAQRLQDLPVLGWNWTEKRRQDTTKEKESSKNGKHAQNMHKTTCGLKHWLHGFTCHNVAQVRPPCETSPGRFGGGAGAGLSSPYYHSIACSCNISEVQKHLLKCFDELLQIKSFLDLQGWLQQAGSHIEHVRVRWSKQHKEREGRGNSQVHSQQRRSAVQLCVTSSCDNKKRFWTFPDA